MTALVPEYEGMTVAEAQQAVVAKLDEAGAIRAKEPYTHTVPFSAVTAATAFAKRWFTLT